MCHPVILWYGCDHLTLTQLKCPLDVLNMEHISDELILACSGNACCLCALPMIPNIQELKSNWLSSSKVAKFFNVETDDRNIEKFIILFFEMGHHVQCEEHAALRLDVATTSRSPPASESGTPAPEPAVEPTQVPSPRSPVAKVWSWVFWALTLKTNSSTAEQAWSFCFSKQTTSEHPEKQSLDLKAVWDYDHISDSDSDSDSGTSYKSSRR